jgi:hypothetical protein
MVVRQLTLASVGGDGPNDVALNVDAFDGCLDKACPSQGGTDWLRAVPQLQPSGAGLEQKGRDDEEVLATYERDLDVAVPAQTPLEVTRRGHPTESATQHDDTQAASSLARMSVVATSRAAGAPRPSMLPH